MKSMGKFIPLPELHHNILLSVLSDSTTKNTNDIEKLKYTSFHEKSPGFNNIIKMLNSK